MEDKKTEPVASAEPTSTESAWGSVQDKKPTKEQIDEMKRFKMM